MVRDKTIGGLFRDLECELHTLAIAIGTFIQIMGKIAKIDEIVRRNKDLYVTIMTFTIKRNSKVV